MKRRWSRLEEVIDANGERYNYRKATQAEGKSKKQRQARSPDHEAVKTDVNAGKGGQGNDQSKDEKLIANQTGIAKERVRRSVIHTEKNLLEDLKIEKDWFKTNGTV